MSMTNAIGSHLLRKLAIFGLLLGAAATGSAQTAERAGGPWEGIKVHGHWTIDIKNPDGTPVATHEFENALQSPGAINMATFLGRVNAPGLWAVLLYSPDGAPNCTASGVPCVMSENRFFAATGGDLAVSVPTSGPNQERLVLTGSFTSPDARSFYRAISGVRLCPTGQVGCSPGAIGGNFTLKDFTPIDVQAGQIVQVTVVIGFS